MSREIKFRAWDKDDNEMKPWHVVRGTRWNSDHACLSEIKERDGGIDMFNAPEYTLMQFTGLLDKNGKEIYDGDIVRIGDYDEGIWIDDDIHSIEYQGGCGYPAFELKPHPGHEMNGLAYVFQSGEQDIEVIGNIHEHNHLFDNNS